MQRADAVDLWPIRDTSKVEAKAAFNVRLRQVVLVDQHLAELVGGDGVFALVRVVVLKQEVAVAVFDDGPGAGFCGLARGAVNLPRTS